MSERRIIGLYAGGLLLLSLICVHGMRVSHQSIDVTGVAAGVLFEGFAAPESGGRWTNNARPRLRFDRPLPRQFMLRMSGYGAGTGQDVVVGVPGGSSQVLHLLAADSTYDVRLENPWLASAIVWTIAPSQSPQSGGDNHDPAIALTRLEVMP